MPAGRGFIVINSNRYKFIQNQEKTQKTTKKSGHPLDFFITGVAKGVVSRHIMISGFANGSAKRDKSRLSGCIFLSFAGPFFFSRRGFDFPDFGCKLLGPF